MSLTDLSYYVRKYLPFFILFVILFLIFYFAVKLFLLYQQVQKPKPLLINPIFNKIKKPLIQDVIKTGKISFTLDTIEGTPTTATSTAKVFFLPPSVSRLGYREKSALMAKAFGIDTDKTNHELKDKEFVYTDESQQLSIDITNFNFTYSLKFENYPYLFENAAIPDENEIKNKAVNFLTTIDRYPEELAQGKINISYYKFDLQSKELNTADKDKANLIRVDFYRPDIDAYLTVTSKYFESQNYILLVYRENEIKIVKAQIRFFEKSNEQVGTYPVKTGDQTWQDLNNGKAFIVAAPKSKTEIKIKEMKLGYFDPDTYQEYLQPVYVFLGEDNFAAYVPAVTSEYFEE